MGVTYRPMTCLPLQWNRSRLRVSNISLFLKQQHDLTEDNRVGAASAFAENYIHLVAAM